MRAHGVPNFPNPNSNGYFPKATVSRLAASNPHYQAAQRACATSGSFAFARCMRAHGVPAFPNPNRSGYFPKATIARIVARNPHYQTAYRACGHLLPNGSQQAATSGPLAFVRCMRAHGVPNFPNPNRNGYFPKATVARLAASNPHYQAAYRVCGHLLPNGSS
jgi:hypothetical protein